MRSPLRIPAFLRALEDYWLANPDQRFGQLVANLTRDENGVLHDGWLWEDGEWLRRIEARHARRTAS